MECSFASAWGLQFTTFSVNGHILASLPSFYASFHQIETPDRCSVLGNVSSGLGISSVFFSESFFMLRTYVLWNKNRILLAVMLTTFFLADELKPSFSSYYNMFFEVMILTILATRMHLDLWQTNRRTHGSGAVVGIAMSDMSFVNVTA
ncbi:hypothetical protein BDR04DRAFT_1118567 [Suillus decipiens]|nr:hypothetical protein BDR04DRAFT_1118567 [Suillus decipiens]